MINNTKILEDSVVQAIDAVTEQSGDLITKIIADLFKSSILKKYKDAYNKEVIHGKVHRENVEKAIDFCFADACASFRLLPGLANEQKETEIQAAKSQIGVIKQTALNILVKKNIQIIQ